MPQISKIVRKDAVTILSDATRGFNATYAALQVGGNYPGIPDLVFDFSATSSNFIQSQVAPQMLDESSNYGYPLMAMYTLGSQDDKDRKFAIFAGLVQLAIDVYISQETNEATADTETMADAIEDAMYSMFNSSSFAPSVLMADAIIYNGDIALSRAPLQQAGENWLQQLAFRLTFQL